MPLGLENNGVVRLRVSQDVSGAIETLRELLLSHGLMVFADIDFSGDAARNGLQMRAERMLVFGHPRGGTPLMQAVPSAGLDLPLKALLWEDEDGATWLAYNSVDYIIARHGLPAALAANLAGAVSLLQKAGA